MQGLVFIDFTVISLEDNAAPTALLVFVTDTAVCNNQGMTVRSGCKTAARTTISVADSGCAPSAGCGDTAAVDDDGASRTTISAADSGCIISAGCGDTAAVDGNLAT